MTQVFLNGNEVDILQPSFSQTFQNNNLIEVKDRQFNFTSALKFPKTPRNIKFFNGLSIPGNNSRVPYLIIDARLVENGIEIVSKGQCLIKKTVKHYQGVIYSGLSELFNFIQNKSIRELDYSDLNHPITVQNVINSFGNRSGYVYPIFGTHETASPEISNYISANTLLPFLFEKTIFEKIIAQAGFSYSGFEDTDFDEQIIAPVNGIDQDFRGEDAIEVIDNTFYSLDVKQSFPLELGTNRKTLSHTFFSFVATKSGHYSFRAHGNANSTAFHRINGTTFNNEKSVYPEDILIEIGNSRSQELKDYSSLTGEFDESRTIYVEEGEEVRVSYFITAATGVTNVGFRNGANFLDLNIIAPFTFELKLAVAQLTADFSLLLPDIKQKDFVKEIMWRYCMSVQRIGNSSEYEFKRIQNIFNDRKNSDDWSNKFSEVISENYSFGSYGQINLFKYAESDDYDGYADGELEVDNQILQKEKTLITSSYHAPLKSFKPLSGNESIYLLDSPFYSSESDERGISKYVSKDLKPRIFRLRYETISGLIIWDLQGNQQSVTAGVPTLTFDGLYWNDLLDDNYFAFKRSIENAKVVTANFNLNTLDIYSLNFFKLKYIKQLGAYFYLNKISNYRQNRLTKVELIQIPPDVNIEDNSTSYEITTYDYGYEYGYNEYSYSYGGGSPGFIGEL